MSRGWSHVSLSSYTVLKDGASYNEICGHLPPLIHVMGDRVQSNLIQRRHHQRLPPRLALSLTRLLQYASHRGNPSSLFISDGGIFHVLISKSNTTCTELLSRTSYKPGAWHSLPSATLKSIPNTFLPSSDSHALPGHHCCQRPTTYTGSWTPQPCPAHCHMQ